MNRDSPQSSFSAILSYFGIFHPSQSAHFFFLDARLPSDPRCLRGWRNDHVHHRRNVHQGRTGA